MCTSVSLLIPSRIYQRLQPHKAPTRLGGVAIPGSTQAQFRWGDDRVHCACDSQFGAIHSEAKTAAKVFKHSAQTWKDAVTSECTTKEVLLLRR